MEARDLSLVVDGRTRFCQLIVPARRANGRLAPLVVVFHGGGSDGPSTERLTGFSRLAAREGFLLAYPEAVARNWNDGRENVSARAFREGVDDLAFLTALLDRLVREYTVDPKRVFAAGISNGAFFSHFAAAHLSGRIAAIAPVVGGLADPFYRRFRPKSPASVLAIQGTDDPLVPYDGGPVARGRRGEALATDDTIRLWRERDGCRSLPKVERLPDRDPNDGCTVTVSTWSGGKGGSEVVLYRIQGGGHTWPGGPQYLPARLIGRVCRDFDATATIWEFFKRHPKA